MNLTLLLDEIKNSLEMLLKREEHFTGSLTLEVHFQNGTAKEVTKSVEKTRHKIKDN